ncbi:hypothetical protein [Tenacibaculum maritimum]|uniref:hypothetical protein n=1 Tax=Tenacibaculum maritimum TaxID=107401 RepID=UPI0012E4676B|nr:hypothetical protein [Tenacibaculum maritimum]CAA0159220.1 hypothetical protein FS0810_100117 [Tenacibaculum maritimum]
MASIFFASFKWGNNFEGDRQQYNAENKTVKDFFEWVQEQREKIQKDFSTDDCIVVNLKIIR